MKKIAIVGAGQLGSRHLQGLASLKREVEIFLVDPFEQSLQMSLDRYHQVKANSQQSIHLLKSIDSLPDKLDVVIVASTSDVRYKLLVELLEHSAVEDIILEKVLFHDLDDYPRALALEASNQARVWVNFAQRLWPFFIDLKAQLFNDPLMDIHILGSLWGLGCNSVHNVDIADFLWVGQSKTTARIDEQLVESKRKKFVEFSGEVITEVQGGGQVRQTCYAEGAAPFVISVTHPTMKKIWDVNNSLLYTSNESTGWKMESSILAAPHQSSLTTEVVATLLSGGECGLPKFNGACKIHVDTIEALLFAAAKVGKNFGRVCPIT